MARLNDHLLRETVSIVYERDRTNTANKRDCHVTALPNIEKFVLAGKEPSRSFRRFIRDNVRMQSVYFDHVTMWYNYNYWELKHSFLNTLFARWARKIQVSSFDWLIRLPRRGYAKMMFESNGIEELEVYMTNNPRKGYHWSAVLKVFPNLIIFHSKSHQFATMLEEAAPGQLNSLNELKLEDPGWNMNKFFHVAHEALSKYQSKCPRLETIRYIDTPLSQIRFPPYGASVPTVKRIKVKTGDKTICCTPFDLPFYVGVQKTFPSLESVESDETFSCDCGNEKGIAQKLETVKQFYKAFEWANYGFFFKTVRRDYLTFKETPSDDLWQFFRTKGYVSGEPLNFTMKRYFPGKLLIYEVNINVVPEGEDDDYDFCYYESPLDRYMNTFVYNDHGYR